MCDDFAQSGSPQFRSMSALPSRQTFFNVSLAHIESQFEQICATYAKKANVYIAIHLFECRHDLKECSTFPVVLSNQSVYCISRVICLSPQPDSVERSATVYIACLVCTLHVLNRLLKHASNVLF